jgi:gamma-glutamyltranspeptidase/glutathione hydrolase
MRPAIELAERGHLLGERQAMVLRWTWPALKHDPGARAVFSKGGLPVREGQRLLQPALARLLKRISESGDAGFYEGPTAQSIVDYMKEHGGWISALDLKHYRAKLRRPLRVDYRDFEVEVMSPPSAGGVAVVEMLTMLSTLAPKGLDLNTVEGLHLFAEVAKRAHAERRFGVVDPDSVDDYDDAARRARWLDPKSWLEKFPIDPNRVTPAADLHPLYAAAMKELDHTTHFSVADREGNVVSCTTTLSGGYGARYLIGELGLLMNNSVAAFGTVGEDVPKPGRRMTSSMSPTILSFDGRAVAALGSPGGDTIPNTVVQVISHLVDGRETLAEAVDAPRIHHGFVPDEIRHERLRPPAKALIAGLKKLGHHIGPARRTIGDANEVVHMGDEFYGYADPREGGLALAPAKSSD